jgi:flagellar basal body rod protein FlgG
MLNTARALSFWRRAHEVTAHNAANVSTTAFKAERITATLTAGMDAPIAAGALDLRQGALRATGNPFDLALEGPGFLVVQTLDGERLVRGGSFGVDPAGRLTDPQGAPLLSTTGPVVVTGSRIEITADGTVLSDGASVGQLRLVEPEERGGLRQEGEGRFAFTGALRSMPGDMTHLRQGWLEESNAAPMDSLIGLIDIQRAFAANMQSLRAMDGVLERIVNEIGRV